MTGKPLYLHGHQPLAVELDGPALRVSQTESADRLFPLERLSRVVASGEVAWSTEALLACADHDIPVSFLRRDGVLRARVLGRPRGRPPVELHEALEALLEDPGGAGRLQDWLAAQSTRARLALARRLHGAPIGADGHALREHLRAQARRYAPEEGLRLLDARLAALLATDVARLLGRAGVTWDDPGTAVHGVDLVRGLAEVVAWELQVPKLRYLWHRHRVAERNGEDYPVVTVRAVTHFYESQAPLVETTVGQLALRLYRFLLEGLDGDAG
jgi:hypothetical protein